MVEPTSLADVFRAAAPGGRELADGVALEASLRAYLDAVLRAWPELEFDDREFVRYLAARAGNGTVQPATWAGDFALAFACTRRDANALAAFHRAFDGVIARVLSRRGAGAELGDDALQVVHERLLVGTPDAAPKVGEYRGTGPLRSWISTTAATTLLILRRARDRRREEPHEDPDAPFAAHVDPELGYLKDRYKGHVHDAIVEGIAKLGDRERTLLRLHLGERLTVDQLGAMYGVNRATAARWLAAARQSLVDAARAELRERLRLSDSECDSIVLLVRSQLDISIVRHLS